MFEGEQPSEKSDIYSLGLISMFVITQVHPFEPKVPIVRLGSTMGAGVTVQLSGVRPSSFS
jgi:hypothetical protein